MTDPEIIAEIRKGKLEKPIQVLYREYPKIRLFLLKEGGNDQIIPELFNDGLVLLIEKVTSPNFELSSRLSTYLTGICRFLLKNELRKKQLNFTDKETHSIFDLPNFDYDSEKEEKLQIIDSILNHIQDRCKQLLQFFYFEKMSMQSIATKMGFSSEQSAKTQKYKCLEKAHKMAMEQNIHLQNPVV